MSDGEFSEYLVAVKRLRVNEGGTDKIYKVPSINSAHSDYFSSLPAVMSGDHQLETFVPPERPAVVGGFCDCRPVLSLHCY